MTLIQNRTNFITYAQVSKIANIFVSGAGICVVLPSKSTFQTRIWQNQYERTSEKLCIILPKNTANFQVF